MCDILYKAGLQFLMVGFNSHVKPERYITQFAYLLFVALTKAQFLSNFGYHILTLPDYIQQKQHHAQYKNFLRIRPVFGLSTGPRILERLGCQRKSGQPVNSVD